MNPFSFHILFDLMIYIIIPNHIVDVATCLRVNIHVPAHAISKSTAHLECTFELENEKQIDFVKMLKNNRLFYVFVPKGDDQIFSVSGIDANVSSTTDSKNKYNQISSIYIINISYFRTWK